MDKLLQLLLDERAVLATATAVFATADRKAWEECEALFAPDVRFEVVLEGESPEGRAMELPRAALLARWRGGLERCAFTQHALSGHAIEVREQRATYTASLQGLHVAPQDAAGENHFLGFGTIRFELARAPDGWRIDAMHFRRLYMLGNRALARR
jgi:hypothetical protein